MSEKLHYDQLDYLRDDLAAARARAEMWKQYVYRMRELFPVTRKVEADLMHEIDAALAEQAQADGGA